MVTLTVSAKNPTDPVASVPSLITTAPVKVFVALSVSVPVPFFVRPAEPASTEVMFPEELFTVIVGVVPPRVIVPPERMMFPDVEPKASELASTVPETVIVPAARPAELVPKFKASVAFVVVVPDITLVPSAEVLQP